MWVVACRAGTRGSSAGKGPTADSLSATAVWLSLRGPVRLYDVRLSGECGFAGMADAVRLKPLARTGVAG